MKGPHTAVRSTSAGLFQAFGYCFEVLVEDRLASELVPVLQDVLEGLSVDSGAGRSPERRYGLTRSSVGQDQVLVEVDRDGQALTGPLPSGAALVSLVSDVNELAVASRSDQLTLHAGAVSFGDAGLALPAPSRSGKTTLTAALVTAGCGYLSDEAVAIDFTTLIMEPYRKPLALSPRSLNALGFRDSPHGPTEMLPATFLRRQPWGPSVRVRMLVFPSYGPGSATTVAPMSRGEALVELANNSFNFVDHGGEWLPGLRDVVAGCSCWRLTTCDASEAAELILERLGS